MPILETWTLWKFSLGISLIALNCFLFQRLHLNLSNKILVAVLRAFSQLLIVGLALNWIFLQSSMIWSLTLMSFMSCIAMITARSRLKWRYKGLGWDLSIGFIGGCWSVTLFFIIFGPSQMGWQETQNIIPFFGFLLGSSLTGMSLTLERLTSLLSERKHIIEAEIALGADRWEAFRPIFATSLLTGLTPIMNTMTVVGVVSLPGIMTGQILAGIDPFKAAIMQLSLMILNAGTTSLSCLLLSWMTLNRFFSKQHQLSPNLWNQGDTYAFTN
ncbi:MAG: ABC transporter permease [Oligoflexales bacterium]